MTQHYANEGKQIKSLLLLANTIAVAKFFLRQYLEINLVHILLFLG